MEPEEQDDGNGGQRKRLQNLVMVLLGRFVEKRRRISSSSHTASSFRQNLVKKDYHFRIFKWNRHKVSGGQDDAKIPEARSGHRMVYLDGSLYTFGGYNPRPTSPDQMEQEGFEGRIFKELWRFDLASSTWTKIPIVGDCPQGTGASYAASLIYDRSLPKMLIYGGTVAPFGHRSSRSMHLLCLETFRWKKIEARCAQDSNVRAGGLVAELGPEELGGNIDEISSPHLPLKMYGQAIATLRTDQGPAMYSLAGTTGYQYFNDVDRFMFDQGRWEVCHRSQGDAIGARSQETEPAPRYRHEVAVLPGGRKIMLLGGGTALSEDEDSFSTVWVFDTTLPGVFGRGKWTKVQTCPDPTAPIHESSEDQYPSPRRCHGCVQLGKYAYMFGGYNGDEVFDDLWRLDLERLQWTQILTNPEPGNSVFFHSVAISPAGKMYSFGGVTDLEKNERTNEVHSMWVIIPTLEEMVWEALQYYIPSLHEMNSSDLKMCGIPVHLVNRLKGASDPLRRN